MWILRLAWKNIWRNKHRTVITTAAVFFAVLLSVLTDSLWKGVFNHMIRNMVSFYSGYIQVHQRGYQNEQVLDKSFQLSDTTVQIIYGNKNVTAFSARLESFALAASKDITKGSLVIGVDPDKEDVITQLKSKIVAGEYLSRSGREVILGEGLAAKLLLKVNDTIVLIGQGYHGATAAGKYRIGGLLKFGSPDLNSKVLYMPLPAAQELYAADGMITSVALQLRHPGALNKTAQALQASLGNSYEVLTWEKMMPEVVQHMRTDTANMKIIQGILYVLICFGIFGTLIMMMVERKFEMGMLVAIGMKKSKLIFLSVAEAVCTVAGGCILGIAVSIPVVFYLHAHPFKFSGNFAQVYERFGFEAIWPTATDPAIFITQGVVVFVIGLVLSLYPVYKIMKIDPVLALKRQ